MIIEDENGRDWTLDELAEREPDEPEEEPPLTLEEIEAAHALTFDKSSSEDPYPAIDLLLERAVPQLLAELRAARERLARWEEVPTREEWTVTADAATPPKDGQRYTIDAALVIAARDGMQAWRRTVADGPIIVRDWEPNPFSEEPPF